jgi:hypothetical protein
MKRFLLLLPLLGVLASCGPTLYTAKDFEKERRQHKTIAVLPFDVTIRTKKLPKGVTQEQIKEQEKETGYNLQGHVYSYFLKRSDDYTIKFQDVDKTNSMLEKAGVTYEAMRGQGKDELAKLLGVDVVLSGKAEMSKPMSDGAAIAIGVVFGVWGNTNEVNASVTIHDSQADLVWKYDHTYSGSVGSSSESLARALMKNVSKKFPYER